MANVPATRKRKIEFYELRLPAWAEHAAALSLTPEQVQEVAELTAEARAAYLERINAVQAALSATARYHAAVKAMSGRGGALLGIIKGAAEAAPDPVALYALASISPPSPPGPVAAPGQPYQVEAQLLASGALRLRWKCRNPRSAVGTMYQLRRRIGFSGPFEHIGLVGVKRFDDHLPPGAAAHGAIEYEVVAARSTRRSQPARCTVSFGSIGSAELGKLAA